MHHAIPSFQKLVRQRGMAMLVLITLMALVSAYFIARGLSNTTATLAAERTHRSDAALQEAKVALIAFAANDSLNKYSIAGVDYPQPGALPCPDTNNDGFAESTCDNPSERVGRLPWRTLRVADLRDDSGEILWYAVSAKFRKKPLVPLVINSSTAGTLTVSGSAPATGAVALVIAPGGALQGQNRDPSSPAALNGVANYLEGLNTNATDDMSVTRVFETRAAPNDRTAAGDVIFNDRLTVISHADLFEAVEPVVAAMIELGVKPYLVTYFAQWASNFPFPAKFANPSPGTNKQVLPAIPSTRLQSQYLGDTTVASEGGGNGRGLLPVTNSATYTFNVGTTSVTLTGGTVGSISGVSCTTVGTPYCTFTLNSLNSPAVCGSFINRYCMVNPSFRVAGEIANVGLSFANMADADVTVTNSAGTTARAMVPTPSLTRALTSAGAATVTFQGTHNYSRFNSAAFTRSMRVTFPVIASPLTSPTDVNAGSFITNEWYRVTYFVVSPAYLPGTASGGCPAQGACLTVNNMPSIYTPPSTNKRAVLILAGRSLNGNARPSATLSDYLEGENATPADYILQHRIVPPSSINDRVVVISP